MNCRRRNRFGGRFELNAAQSQFYWPGHAAVLKQEDAAKNSVQFTPRSTTNSIRSVIWWPVAFTRHFAKYGHQRAHATILD
jgi:hypothetical protein